MIKKSIVTSMLICSFATISLNAQDNKDRPKRDPEELFKKLDTDGDGKVSKAEADKSEFKMIKEHFNEIDKNADGYISKDEFKAFKPQGAPPKKEK